MLNDAKQLLPYHAVNCLHQYRRFITPTHLTFLEKKAESILTSTSKLQRLRPVNHAAPVYSR